MTALTHYVRIPYPPRHGAGSAARGKVITEVFRALHEDRSLPEVAYPVALPADRIDAADVGDALIVFGTPNELAWLAGPSSETSRALAEEGLAVGAISEVPSDAPHAVHRRVRHEAVTPATIARRRRRGEAIAARQGRPYEERPDPVTTKGRFVPLPFFVIRTDGSARGAPLHVRQDMTESPVPGGFGAYGLSHDGASVPLVS